MWEGKFCQVCYLVGLTSQQVLWDEQERQGYTAEGEAIGSVMVWSVMGEPGFDPAPFNSTSDTAATSRWLPHRTVVNMRSNGLHVVVHDWCRDRLTTPTLP